jgi:hypothetical protein
VPAVGSASAPGSERPFEGAFPVAGVRDEEHQLPVSETRYLTVARYGSNLMSIKRLGMRMAQVRTRTRGAIVAGVLMALIAAVAYWCGADAVMATAGFGAPIGAGVAYWIAPRALSPGRAISSAILSAFVAIGIALITVAGLGFADAVLRGSPGLLLYFPAVIVSTIVFGLPIAVPVAAMVVALLKLSERRPGLGLRLVAPLAGLTIVLGGAAIALDPALEARRGVDLRRADEPPIALLLARTTVSWSVVNCSPWRYSITLSQRPLLDGILTTRLEAPAGATSRATRVVEPGWLLTIEVDDAEATIPSAYFGPKPIIEDLPARAVEVRIEIGPRGMFSSGVAIDGMTMSEQVPECPGS